MVHTEGKVLPTPHAPVRVFIHYHGRHFFCQNCYCARDIFNISFDWEIGRDKWLFLLKGLAFIFFRGV